MKKICILALFNIVFGTIHGQWQQTNGPIGGNVQCYASVGSTILVGVQNGIYKSVNSGLTWIPSDNGISCVNPNCMIVSGNTIFAGTSSGVFISTDLGMNWAASNTGLPIIAQVNCLAIKGQTLFAGTPGGGYVSFNNGLSWIGCGPLTPTLTNGISAFICVGDTVIAASGCLGMFRSTDNGSSWTNVSTGIPSFPLQPQCHLIHSLLANNNSIYAGVTGGNGLYKSIDWGYTWNPVNTGFTHTSVTSLASLNNSIVVLTDTGIVSSNNSGLTWSIVNPTDNSLFSTVFITPSMVFAGASSGVYKSADGGQTWVRANTGLIHTRAQSLVTIGNNLITGTKNTGSFITNDQGNNWIGSTGEPPFDTQLCLTSNGSTLFAGYLGSGVYKSTNNGLTWTSSNTNIENKPIRCLAASGTTLIAGSDNLETYLSIDNGASWTLAAGSLSMVGDFHYLVADGSDFYGLMSGSICVSSDQGNSWTSIHTGITGQALCLAVTASHLFVGTTNQGVFSRPKNGTSWSSTNTNTNSGLYNGTGVGSIKAIGPDLFIGTNYGVFLSNDQATTWIDITSGFNSCSLIKSFESENGILYAGTVSEGVWKRPINQVTALTENQTNEDIIVYPNPFVDEFSLRSNSKKQFVCLRNCLGQKVKELKCNEGETIVNLSEFESGIYFLEIISQTNKSYIKKLIKQ